MVIAVASGGVRGGYMNIIERKIDSIRPYERNPRKNEAAVNAVAASISEFGFKVPIVVDAGGVIVAGHTRYKAAQKLGLDTVPCIIADDLTPGQIKAFRLADNKVQELSSWDFSLLMDELTDIDGIDMEQFGFAYGEEEELHNHRKTEGSRTSNLDDGFEIDIDSFDEEEFACECPECGFRFNE